MSARSARIILIALLSILTLAFWPVGSRVGVNYEVGERRLPLWEKTWAFLDRHRKTSELANRLSAPFPDAEARALALLAWTRNHVGRRPAGVELVDDHVWSIIERGYGSNDQMADVYTTLLTYSGLPARWRVIGPGRRDFPISLALINGSWRVFEVEYGVVFRDSAGRLATEEAIATDPDIVREAAAAAGVDPDWYARWFDGFQPSTPPRVLRAEMQMPWPRLRYEARRVLRRGQ